MKFSTEPQSFYIYTTYIHIFYLNGNSCLPPYIHLDPNFFYEFVSLPNHKPTAPTIGSMDLMSVAIMLTRMVNDAQFT
jgi:hypothetical protein